MVEFTDHDAHMLKVLDDLGQVADELAEYSLWLRDEWSEVSDDPMPFFRVHERKLPNGKSQCDLVFLLRSMEVDSSELDGYRH